MKEIGGEEECRERAEIRSLADMKKSSPASGTAQTFSMNGCSRYRSLNCIPLKVIRSGWSMTRRCKRP